jgi:deoxyadenosine/deoxycytidine kinase
MTQGLYIGFEGPIGAGKTTLAQLLAAHTGARLLLENVDGNEFLPDFYADHPRWALAMQLSFLVTRHGQLSAAASLGGAAIVADYTLAKDAIFASMLLRDRELRLYDDIAAGFTAGMAQPNLVVYLDAEDSVLLDRIRKRGHPYEASITSSYLDSIRGAYEKHFASTAALTILRYDTTTLNLKSELELGALYVRILSACSSGTTEDQAAVL